jgi:hypothetical protein
MVLQNFSKEFLIAACVFFSFLEFSPEYLKSAEELCLDQVLGNPGWVLFHILPPMHMRPKQKTMFLAYILRNVTIPESAATEFLTPTAVYQDLA